MVSVNSFPEWVPREIVEGYKEKGVLGLFDWQSEALASCSENHVFCAPTSAGKGLVADLLALRVALTGRRVLLVLPYIAVAREKLSFLQKLWRNVDIQVAAYIGSSSACLREWTAAVCTIEKANSLINHAVLDGSIGEYGMVVLDELHMILDPSRGATLDALVTKISYYNSRAEPLYRMNIVGMSATLPDPPRIAKWLSAEVSETDFRPIELQHNYSCDGIVYGMGSRKILRRLDKKYRFPGDVDCTIGFCVETVLERKSTLVFCSSKNEVEKTALDIARVMDTELKKPGVAEYLLSQEALLELKDILERNCKQLDPILAKCLPRGVAYHHAGLTTEERECVEKAFREGTVHALVATSTLSSGVNLPAYRVIIKAQTRGPAALNSTNYGQMAGRAGRMGFTEKGESYVTIKPSELQAALRLITTPPPSGISSTRDASKVILEGVCSGLTSSVSGVHDLSSRLLYSPTTSPEQTLIELAAQSFISRPDNDNEEESEDISLSATQLGRAALASSLPPEAALFVFADLTNASKSLSIDTELHMMYLVTPINTTVWQGCDWNHLHSIFCKLDSNQKRVAKMVGANERFIMERIRGKFIQERDRDNQLHLRFFSALALFDVITEVPLVEVAKKFRLCRGALQALQQQSATYAVMVVAFCNRLGWQYLRALLEGFAARLSFGVRAELTELVRVEGIDGSRARIFHDHGITSVAQLAQSTVDEVAAVLSLAVPFESGENVHDGRREWLFGEDRMLLEEAAHTVVLRAGQEVQERMKELGIVVDFAKQQIQLSQQKTQRSTQGSSQMSQVNRTVHRDPTQRPPPLRLNLRNTSQEAPVSLNQSIQEHFNSSGVFDESKENIPPNTPRNKDSGATDGNFASTPVSKAARFSLSCSRIDESAIDIFSDSLLEMSLDERDAVEKEATEVNCAPDVEVDDLETSLQKLNNSIIEDSFDRTVEFVTINQNSIAPRRSIFEDSFDLPLSQVLARRSIGAPKHRNSLPISEESKADESAINLSGDIFESSPVQQAPKRNRNSMGCWSPSVASPLGKVSRPSTSTSSNFLCAEDVCRSISAWNSFVSRSSRWSSASMAIVRNATRDAVIAVAFCTENGQPDFIPFTEDCYPGSAMEEAMCPSSTQSQSISIADRIQQVQKILEECDISCYDLLSISTQLRKSLALRLERGVCVALIAFLAHQRAGEAPAPLPRLAARFEWPFKIDHLLKMNPRVKACAEAYVISRILDRLKSEASRQSSDRALRLEIEAVRVVSSISAGGFPFSRSLCASILTSMRQEMSLIEDECHRLAGKPFNLESAIAVSDVLYRQLKLLHPGGQTVAGKRHLSTNKAILTQMIDKHPIVAKILKFRSLKHAVSQCLLPLEGHACEDDVIRTSFEVCTATGRLLSNRPNVQNVPNGEIIDGFSVRSLFAAKQGRVLVAADYCQLELRVLAHLSADPTLLKRLSDEGRDFFSDLSSEWGFPRDAVKQLCYGLIYGMGVKSLADSTKTTVPEAQRLLDSFFRSFPKVNSYIAKTKEMAESVGFVSTFLGRRRLACTRGRQEERSRDHRQSVNFTIQGTASEIFKKAITNIHSALSDVDARIAMIVHDEVIIDSCEEAASRVMSVLKKEMEGVFPEFRLPLKVKVIKGANWSVLK